MGKTEKWGIFQQTDLNSNGPVRLNFWSSAEFQRSRSSEQWCAEAQKKKNGGHHFQFFSISLQTQTTRKNRENLAFGAQNEPQGAKELWTLVLIS